MRYKRRTQTTQIDEIESTQVMPRISLGNKSESTELKRMEINHIANRKLVKAHAHDLRPSLNASQASLLSYKKLIQKYPNQKTKNGSKIPLQAEEASMIWSSLLWQLSQAFFRKID